MNNIKEYGLQRASVPDPQWGGSHFVGRGLAKATALIWRWGNDRQAVVSFVGRYSAHAAILVLALLVSTFGRLALAPISSASPEEFNPLSQAAMAVAVATPTQPAPSGPADWELATQRNRAVFRQAQPYTTIPERVRLEVITYTIRSGDNIFSIAQYFKLSPYTIVWANMEPLQGAPWLIQPGLPLFIPPVDGAYHTVMAGDTIDSIAEHYEVASAVIYNQWNPVSPDQELREGMLLVIPGGVGDEIEWEPPPPPPARPVVGAAAASASWGACGNVSVSGPGARGWFILPTGSYAVSGWYFRSPSNPNHIGLDYTCRLGDPIYAADNGVVVFAGWSGGYGNLVIVDHGNGYQTRYAHFSAFAVGCGQPVYQGSVVGYCGSTGWSTGPHLHYEIRLNGVPQNPKLFEP